MDHSSQKNRAGFTLVEFLVATLLGSILVVSTGIMLSHSFRELDFSRESLESQRDVTFAINVMRREIQLAASSNITTAASSITIQKAGYASQIYVQDNDLMFDPSSLTSGDEVILIDEYLDAFAPSLETNLGVRASISILVKGKTNTTSALSGFRNE